ncbi:MAG: hypothetical protein WC004_00480 [Candidatus Absconditabacterales bacterium]
MLQIVYRRRLLFHTGGGSGHGRQSDSYPDGWQITAKKLDVGLWDEDGKEIMFYQSGGFTCQINEELPIIKKMKMMFV